MRTYCIKYLKIAFLASLTALFLPAALFARPDGGKLELKTVVIDAGHGGKDAGAISADRKTYEKNLTLAISKLLGQKIEKAYPDINVVYTRTTDKYLTLNERADIANNAHADLFISIHINAFTRTAPNGFSAHILGQSSDRNKDLFSFNQDLCRRENSVILLEEDYQTKYHGFDPNDPESFIMFSLMQNAYYEQSILFAAEVNSQMDKGPLRTNRGISQNGFYLLWRTSMPSVLLELGFISNPEDLKVLNSSSGKEDISTRLFEAFRQFKKKYDGSIDYQVEGQPETSGTEPAAQPASPAGKEAGPAPVKETVSSPATSAATAYGVQILVLSRPLEEGDGSFKGLKPDVYRNGKIYKYVVPAGKSLSEAKELHSQIKAKFPDSFVVKVQSGAVSRP